MALTDDVIADKIEVLESGVVQVRTARVIKDDDIEINRTFHRHCLTPCGATAEDATDVSGEDARVQAVCAAVWTDEVKIAWVAITSPP